MLRLEIRDIILWNISLDLHRRLVIDTIHRYLYYLAFISLFIHISLSLVIAGILVLISYWNYCKYCIYSLLWGLAYVREGISALRMNVAIASSYLRDRGVTSIVRNQITEAHAIIHSNITVQVYYYHRYDPILYEYYITGAFKSMNFQEICKINLVDAHELERDLESRSKEWIRRIC